MKNNFKVSAIIPIYNRANDIHVTLNSLLNQSIKFYEIIAVDDGSDDNTVNIIKEFVNIYKEIKLIETNNFETDGRIIARNIGARMATGDLLAFIESDCELNRDWLKNILIGFQNGYEAALDRRRSYYPKTFIGKMEDHFLDMRLTHSYKIYFSQDSIMYHMGEPHTFKQAFKRNFWFGSHIIPYLKKIGFRRNKKYYLKAFIFIFYPFLLIWPLIFLALIFLLYLYIFQGDLRKGIKLKYLFIHPIYYLIVNEYANYLGLIYSLIFCKAPLSARTNDAQYK